MRHAERLDRYLEAKGEDWISTAPRPQDSPLSPAGRDQARRVAQQLKDSGFRIRFILCSPMVRCVETADLVAGELGLGAGSLRVEPGLVEESKAMRGKAAPEPPPVWPLHLPVSQLLDVSPRIDESFVPLLPVHHVKNEAYPNQVQEVLDDCDETNADTVTSIRCRNFVSALMQADGMAEEECVLCVGHGASVKYCAEALQEGLPADRVLAGERGVSCFAAFCPLEVTAGGSGQDSRLPRGPWHAPKGVWGTGSEVSDVDASVSGGRSSGGSVVHDRGDDQG